MVLSNVQLYESLKKDMSKESARLLVEAISPERDVATRADLASLENRLRIAIRDEVGQVRDEVGKVRDEVGKVRDEVAHLRKEFTRWILAFFVPLWITAAAAIVTGLIGR
jgi:hypothetical protein